MKTKITGSDFFCFLEMINRDVELKMNESTYKKIIGDTFGFTNYAAITNVIPNINGLHIIFDNTMSSCDVTITANYTPHTAKSFDIEII